MLEDRRRQPVAAEEGPDADRLALQRVGRRRVVQEHDPERAHRDRAQALVEGGDVGCCGGVHLAQLRLAEVREV